MGMKSKGICIIFFLFFVSAVANSQENRNTSATKSSEKSLISEKRSVILANDFIFTISLTFEQIFSLTDNWHAVLRAGPGYSGESGSDLVFEGQASFLGGKSVHFFETGIGYYHNITYPDAFIVPLAGYRYMGKKGFIFKFYGDILLDIIDDSEWGFCNLGVHLSIGYRFRF